MTRILIFLLFAVLSAPLAYAAEVVKVKGKGVLVELKGDPAVNGDQFFLIAPDGKRRGIIKISKVKGDKAIGKLIKGKAAPGFTLEFKPQKVAGGGAKKSADTMAAPSMDDGSTVAKRSYWGALVGYSRDTMKVAVKTNTNPPADIGVSEMSGSGFSAKGLFDYELFSQIWFRGTAGIEMFNATGNSICNSSSTTGVGGVPCDAKLTYLTFDFIGRYVFGKGSFRPWVGGGLGLLFPASKDSTALDPASISTTNVMVAAGGFDYFTSPTFYIPISVEYGLLPKSDEVEASWIAIRGGFAVPF